MNATVKAIATILRSTEPMAAQFAQRVQDRAGQPVSFDEILAAMEKIPTKKLSLEKVVAKVQEQKNRTARKTSRRRTTTPRTKQPALRSTNVTKATRSSATSSKKPKTVLERLDAVLQKNWDRAESEGLAPNRSSAEGFISAVYNHTDRREATRQRILQAARQLNEADVLLTPALVADAVHQLF